MTHPFTALPPISGEAFLLLYGALFILAVWISIRRRSKAFDRFNAAEAVMTENPYQLAYLSAGPSRVVMLTVLALVTKGRVRMKKTLLGRRLVAMDEPGAGPLSHEETQLLKAMRTRGARGVALNDCGILLADVLASLEKKLASLGLRPTTNERHGAAFRAGAPLALLLLFGILRLITGFSGNKPVGFLIACLVVTVITLFLIQAGTKWITPAGKHVLDVQRERNRSLRLLQKTPDRGQPSDFSEMATAFALFGPTAIQSLPVYAEVLKPLQKAISGTSSNSADGDVSGGSSGCSSGCGGGGCGGCGGGD